MQSFPDWIRQHLERSGYLTIRQGTLDVLMKAFNGEKIWICYLDSEITPEQIRRTFEFDGYMLFVVNDNLIPQEIESREATPMWLRILHGLYMGRVYTWNGRFLYGLHFDYDTGDISESAAIQPDSLILIETGTWLRGWTGVYKLARFFEKAWWVSEGDTTWDSNFYRQQKQTRQQKQQADDDFQRRAREQFNQQSQKQGSSPKQDFMREFNQCGSLAEVKAIFRKLAMKYHPDLNPDQDTTETMQQVNAAYDQVVRRWS